MISRARLHAKDFRAGRGARSFHEGMVGRRLVACGLQVRREYVPNQSVMPKKGARIDPESSGPTSGELLAKARAGDPRALSALFRQQGSALRRWARGRLPSWARRVTDTADVVQDALLQTFRHLDRFEDRGRGALQAYLRQAVDNRIRDELRRIGRRPLADVDAHSIRLRDQGPSPFDVAADAEHEHAYKDALSSLTPEERQLVVGRLELGYSYDQLALVSGRPTVEAARMAVRRAVTKLARRMARV
jgi:RNA polymerase sigma factor (sigma-70 family)